MEGLLLREQRAPLYDKAQEGHYNLISALHKAMRGSDPDAALYWLARMQPPHHTGALPPRSGAAARSSAPCGSRCRGPSWPTQADLAVLSLRTTTAGVIYR
ncbi:hypothetical protein [Streptomyces werraensis]|uniref:hypothetical protein n=1 Tax=Streptomyces werraensis TaxID=68284 RepID=UPI003F4DF0B9